MATGLDLAKLLLRLGDQHDDPITHLKLQKLLYYCQGFHLAMTGERLFDESVKAWAHGPVVGSVYYEFREHGRKPIPPPDPDWSPDMFTSEQLSLICDVYGTYGQYTGWALREMTHGEPPWADHYVEGEMGTRIADASMAAYFTTQIE
jgi:uncharacterized phage-associated protein